MIYYLIAGRYGLIARESVTEKWPISEFSTEANLAKWTKLCMDQDGDGRDVEKVEFQDGDFPAQFAHITYVES